VLTCYTSMADTVIHSEIGASTAILEAGFAFDSLMLRYQGVDWRHPHLPTCNAGLNPLQPGFNDGVTGEGERRRGMRPQCFLDSQGVRE
jgi:hypothetical protein